MVQIPEKVKQLDQPNVQNQSQPLRWHCLNYKGGATCNSECHFQDLLALFSKTNALSILRQLLLKGTLRFNELLQEVGGSPKTLTVRLRDLEQFGLLERRVFHEVPIRVEYSLTNPGKDLEDLFERMALWIRKWRAEIAV